MIATRVALDHHEVYVRPYPGDGPATRVSVDGGSCPAWGKKGRELYFVGPVDEDGRGRIMVVDVGGGLAAANRNLRTPP